MKSAYATLGIPGNASAEDIAEAFRRVSSHYSRERLVENPDLAEKLNEAREAYKVLSNQETREAHDRKLSQSVARPVVRPVIEDEKASFGLGTLIKVLGVLAIAMFATGAYISHNREQARQAQAAEELAQKKLEAEAAAEEARQKEAAEASKARRDNLAEARERQLRAESLMVARQTEVLEAVRQAQANRQAEAARNAEKFEERRRTAEAERKLAEDRWIIRRR
ncbi:DnaJ domain-containing protein [Variovorax ureilyticus]|uniref:DnaJ domain-containing protein n=1 Tax=Variovorax ureilyticus TaxID=1836198 RepID=UPI003D677FBE